MACYGLLCLAPLLIVVGVSKAPDAVASSFSGEGLVVWMTAIAGWIAILALNLGAGAFFARRRVVIGSGYVTVQKAMGGETRVEARDVSEMRVVHSQAGIINTVIKLKYTEGSRAILDLTGFGGPDVRAVADFIASLKRRDAKPISRSEQM